ncbi:MAG: hypothetical protein ACE5WD_14070 [Candidatus Aminicenantia bacterium]
MTKKLLSFLCVVSLLFLLTNCQKPEKGLLKRYFHAVSLKDTTTLSTMAIEPISLDFTSWTIVNISEEEVEPVILPELNKKEKEAKNKLDDHTGIVLDLRDELDIAKMELENARTRRAKRAAQKIVDEKQELYDTEYEIHKQLQKEYNEAKAAAAKEEQIANFSVPGELAYLRDMSGEVHKKEVVVELNTPKGLKKYRVYLRKYTLHDPETSVTYRGRWIILKFEPISG